MNEILSSSDSDLPSGAPSSKREHTRDEVEQRREQLKAWREQQREGIKEAHWQERARLIADATEQQATRLEVYFKDKILPGGLRIVRDPRLSTTDPLVSSHLFTVYDRHGNPLGRLTCSFSNPPLSLRMDMSTQAYPQEDKAVEATDPRGVERWLRYEIPTLLLLNAKLAEAAGQRPSLAFLNGSILFEGRLSAVEHRENGVVFYTIHDASQQVVGKIMPTLSRPNSTDFNASWSFNLYDLQTSLNPEPQTLNEFSALIRKNPRLLAQIQASDSASTVAMHDDSLDNDQHKTD